MARSFTWRDLLAEIIADPSERYQLATRLNVHPLTLTRWSTGISTPRLESLYHLIEVLPAYEGQLRSLIIQEIPEFERMDTSIAQRMAEHISSAFYMEILALCATASQPHRGRIISERLLSSLLEQLDPLQIGTMVKIVLFTPPLVGKPVRSLHIFMRRVIPAVWEQELHATYPYLFGAESLTGYSVQTNHSLSLYTPVMRDWPIMRIAEVKRVVSCPIRSFSRIAGCLCVISKQVGHFLPSQIHLIDAYAQLAALAFDEDDFYEFERISLSLFPPGQEQAPFARAVQQQMLHQNDAGPDFPYPHTPQQIERHFWQLVEQRFLD